jgi:hypothetical protein
VTPADRTLRVSRRIHDEFQNGREYYALDGRELRAPLPGYPLTSAEALEWHADTVFRG